MKYSFFYIFLIARAFAADPIAQQLDALQQLRSLIPERVWFQEFSILVDTEGFEDQAKKLMDHPRRDEAIEPSYAIAQSTGYFLFSTMSGESVRLLDRYQQFEQSPFWRTPEAMDRLKWLESK